MPEVLRIPIVEDLANIAKEYDEKCRFPNCFGAMDGKHITVQCAFLIPDRSFGTTKAGSSIPNLMRPYKGENLPPEQTIFNYHLSIETVN